MFYRDTTTAREMVLLDSDMIQLFDDGVALMMLANDPRIELLGVTIVSGNTWVHEGTAYALRQLEIIGHPDIAVAPGARFPLRANRRENVRLEQEMFGRSRYIGCFQRPEPPSHLDIGAAPYGGYASIRPVAQHGVDLIIDAVRGNPGDVTVVAVGPCTNLALAIRKAPEIVPLVKQVIYMGGAFDVPGNTTPAAEFNWWFDPEAARMCLRAPFAAQTIVSLDACSKYGFGKALFDRIVAAGVPVSSMFEAIYGEFFRANPCGTKSVWDVIAAAIIIDPSIATEVEDRWVDVDDSYGINYGRSVGYRDQGPAGTRKASILLSVDEEKLWDLVATLLTQPMG